tara:strand:- start:404 stop:736 length:333 start_codon:yes stop_codon:yes gene_type:complete
MTANIKRTSTTEQNVSLRTVRYEVHVDGEWQRDFTHVDEAIDARDAINKGAYQMPNDISELMIDAAAALENGDAIALRQLMAHCQDWMQTEKEASAQAAMLQAMMDAVDQ